ncbi:MAG: Peptidase M16 inactive domain protein [candidate division BRC1 bacterium ADurb.BinA364]|nr:MAG: Peptidase M16 inactive domain protein [candidate division BRC1 bacterium ADurb.BinA364]
MREAYAAVAYPAPSIEDPDAVIAADVLQFALAEGRASRLYREIKEKRQLATSISASYPTHRYDSLFMIFATTPPEKLDGCRLAIEEQLDRARNELFSKDEIQRAKRLLVNAHLFSKETTDGASSVLGYYYTLTGGLEFEEQYQKRAEAVTAKDIREAARRIFDPSKAVYAEIHPKASGGQ